MVFCVYKIIFEYNKNCLKMIVNHFKMLYNVNNRKINIHAC